MVRCSPSQVVPNTPGVWLGIIAWNLWSEDYQDFDADVDDDAADVYDKIKEIWSRCRTCFSKFDYPVSPHLGLEALIGFVWSIFGRLSDLLR